MAYAILVSFHFNSPNLDTKAFDKGTRLVLNIRELGVAREVMPPHLSSDFELTSTGGFPARLRAQVTSFSVMPGPSYRFAHPNDLWAEPLR
jgi:hypothetical protein